MVLRILLVGLEQVVVDVLGAEFGVDTFQPKGFKLLHHQGAGRVLGQRLIYPQRNLLAGTHHPIDEVRSDQLGGEVLRAIVGWRVSRNPRTPAVYPSATADQAGGTPICVTTQAG